jgi:hypothetical protein
VHGSTHTNIHLEITMSKQDQIQEALERLNEVNTLIFNIEGDRWQMAYDVLESVLSNLMIESKPYHD